MKKFYTNLLATSLLGITFSMSASAANILNRGNGSEPQTLDPQISEGVPSSHIQRDIFEGLVAEDMSGKITKGVISEMPEISEDGMTYTFKIRDDAVWSNGDALTAEDFVYSLRRAVDPEVASNYSFMVYPIKNAEKVNKGELPIEELGVKAIDEKTLRIDLEAVTPYFLQMLSHSIASPVHKATVEKYGAAWTKPENIVTNGPFRLTKWVPNNILSVEKNDKYWDAENVKLDGVNFFPIEDKNVDLEGYIAGDIDIVDEIPPEQIDWIKENLSDDLVSHNNLGIYYYGFNTSKPPFDNENLRKAINLVTNRKLITEKILRTGEKPAYSMVPPGIDNYTNIYWSYKDVPYKDRVLEAQELFKKEGYGPNNPLEIEFLYNTADNHKRIATALIDSWQLALPGLKVSMRNMEWKAFLEERTRAINTQISRMGWIGDYNDPNTFLELFKSDSGLNDTKWKNEEYDNLVKEAAKTIDLEERAKILQEAEKLLLESSAVIPIYYYGISRVVKPYVKGYEINLMNRNRSKYIYLEK